MKITYRVEGMTCDHCVNAVMGELTGLPGVTRVDIDLEAGEVTVESAGELARSSVAAAVVEAGYELVD